MNKINLIWLDPISEILVKKIDIMLNNPKQANSKINKLDK